MFWLCLFHISFTVKSFWFIHKRTGLRLHRRRISWKWLLKATLNRGIIQVWICNVKREGILTVCGKSMGDMACFQTVRLFPVTMKIPRFDTAHSQFIPVCAISIMGQRWGTVHAQSQSSSVCVKWPKLVYLYYSNKKSGQPCLQLNTDDSTQEPIVLLFLAACCNTGHTHTLSANAILVSPFILLDYFEAINHVWYFLLYDYFPLFFSLFYSYLQGLEAEGRNAEI